ncbi:ABC-type transport auxiliary lipoprotein family protein [Rhodoferax sp. PAMC 29310]|uniref:ABC-type transport auxiliary lipoprotein family protein n=1 Tax=Rhodoferax sp. PAMC 29310 TaxID=2822760 RepID=UPI001B330F33|nr:ABC-type transport auxiliary lipoprotein family protein [Rhodoferax sp. PAMC 29310]
MNTAKFIATPVHSSWAGGLFLVFSLALSGCANSIQPVRPAVYDFGPGLVTGTAASSAATRAPLIMGTVESTPALESLALHYRLSYANGQQLKPYAHARWSMAPAQLIRQRLSEQLSQTRAILNPGESGLAGTAAPATLRIDLEEFSQLFEAPAQSVGLIRLRATLIQPSQTPRVIQHSVVVRRPAPSADAKGGVQALTAATDAAVLEIDNWLRLHAP